MELQSTQESIEVKTEAKITDGTENDDESSQNPGASAMDIFQHFSDESGLHGINKLQKNSRPLWQRFIWICVILGCLVYLIITVTKEIQKFYSYPTTTSIDIEINRELAFPAVTICNLSPLNRSKQSSDPRSINYDLATSVFFYYAERINWSDPYYKQHGYFEPISKNFIMKNLSMELSKMLTISSFDNILKRSDKLFKQTFTTVGPCYIFNQDGAVKTERSGGSYNLNVFAFIDQKNYYHSFSFGSGVKVVVHDPSQRPDIVNEGFFVPPGSLAYISIAKENYEYLPHPYKALKHDYCLALEAKSYKNPLKYSNYSYTACIEECFEELIVKAINCTLPELPGDGRTCSKYEAKESMAKLILLYEEESKTCIKKCPLPCKFTKFVSQISYAQFPSDFINAQLKKFIGNANVTPEFTRSNFLSVQVFYEQLSTKTFRQVPVYSSLEQLLANLGGQMGLFLGASIITAMEIFEFLISLLSLCFKSTVCKSVAYKVSKEKF